jgi:D-alanine-D-alanine ligase
MVFKVGLTYNLKKKVNKDMKLPEDYFSEFDDIETVDAISNAIEKNGCEVIKIEADQKAYVKLLKLKPDIVFNIAEGLYGEGRESQIPAMLEMLKIPYTGSGPVTLAISLNKELTHKILSANGVYTPLFKVFNDAKEIRDVSLAFPLVVKPIAEGSGKGIRSNSLVKDFQSLKNQVRWITKTYKQPAIVEDFIEGREFTVGIIGNQKPKVLPIVEILFDNLPKGSNPLYAYEAKWIWDVPEKPLDIFKCPAEITHKLEAEIKKTAVKAFRALNCKDICRMDIRLDENGKPNVLDLNPLPGMIPDPDAHSCLPEAAMVAGYTYEQLICTILWQAIERNNLQAKSAETSLKIQSRMIG